MGKRCFGLLIDDLELETNYNCCCLLLGFVVVNLGFGLCCSVVVV